MKGWLERLRPGLFQLVPANRGPASVPDTHPFIAGVALVEPYFFSFGTACSFHGLTDQAFSEVYLACRQHRRAVTIRGMRHVFVHVAEERFFGFAETSVLGKTVLMATMERALLDALDRPRYAAGIGEVSRMAARAGSRLSWQVMLEFLDRWHSSAIVQRLGYFLDLHGSSVPDEAREALLNLLLPRSKIHLGPRRRWGTTGRLVRPWNVVENVPLEVLRPPVRGHLSPPAEPRSRSGDPRPQHGPPVPDQEKRLPPHGGRGA